MRLDVFLVKNSIFSSRELAKYNISQGNVLVNGKVALKPSADVGEHDIVELNHSNALRYVSRGGLKLEKALLEFGVDCNGWDVLDVGASTGGFTDCLLQKDARMVYAVDVGSNQLAEKLKSDKRVVSIENTNIKDLSDNHISGKRFHLIVADISFVSLTKVLSFFSRFLLPDGQVVTLIKPQFEVGQMNIGKGGIVKDAKWHVTAIENVFNEAEKNFLFPTRLTFSPLIESGKNIEYLALFESTPKGIPLINEVVADAFRDLAESKNQKCW